MPRGKTKPIAHLRACLAWWAAFLLLCSLACHAQDFPSRSIRLIVPQAPGGGTDILGRNVAQKLGEQLHQPAIVENRTGAGSLVGTEYVARAPADGYTLLVGGIFNIVMNKALIKNISYDPLRDLVPLGFTSAYPFVLLARPDLPVSNLAELVKYAKEKPGSLTYGSAGIGTLQHVWGAILFKSLGMDALHVPFKGAAAAHQEMMAGRLDLLFDNMSASKQYVQSGRLKALAVSSASRSSHLPEVPTVNETGLVKFEGESWFGLFAPAGTPAPVVGILRKALAGITGDQEFAARIERDGGRVLAIPPQEQLRFMREEIERWTQLVARYGVTVD
ncbi:MAG TPA: tripartite tricarboxylate transporter substrate binding protein [Burkholderiales bacterium]